MESTNLFAYQTAILSITGDKRWKDAESHISQSNEVNSHKQMKAKTKRKITSPIQVGSAFEVNGKRMRSVLKNSIDFKQSQDSSLVKKDILAPNMVTESLKIFKSDGQSKDEAFEKMFINNVSKSFGKNFKTGEAASDFIDSQLASGAVNKDVVAKLGEKLEKDASFDITKETATDMEKALANVIYNPKITSVGSEQTCSMVQYTMFHQFSELAYDYNLSQDKLDVAKEAKAGLNKDGEFFVVAPEFHNEFASRPKKIIITKEEMEALVKESPEKASKYNPASINDIKREAKWIREEEAEINRTRIVAKVPGVTTRIFKEAKGVVSSIRGDISNASSAIASAAKKLLPPMGEATRNGIIAVEEKISGIVMAVDGVGVMARNEISEIIAESKRFVGELSTDISEMGTKAKNAVVGLARDVNNGMNLYADKMADSADSLIDKAINIGDAISADIERAKNGVKKMLTPKEVPVSEKQQSAETSFKVIMENIDMNEQQEELVKWLHSGNTQYLSAPIMEKLVDFCARTLAHSSAPEKGDAFKTERNDMNLIRALRELDKKGSIMSKIGGMLTFKTTPSNLYSTVMKRAKENEAYNKNAKDEIFATVETRTDNMIESVDKVIEEGMYPKLGGLIGMQTMFEMGYFSRVEESKQVAMVTKMASDLRLGGNVPVNGVEKMSGEEIFQILEADKTGKAYEMFYNVLKTPEMDQVSFETMTAEPVTFVKFTAFKEDIVKNKSVPQGKKAVDLIIPTENNDIEFMRIRAKFEKDPETAAKELNYYVLSGKYADTPSAFVKEQLPILVAKQMRNSFVKSPSSHEFVWGHLQSIFADGQKSTSILSRLKTTNVEDSVIMLNGQVEQILNNPDYNLNFNDGLGFDYNKSESGNRFLSPKEIGQMYRKNHRDRANRKQKVIAEELKGKYIPTEELENFVIPNKKHGLTPFYALDDKQKTLILDRFAEKMWAINQKTNKPFGDSIMLALENIQKDPVVAKDFLPALYKHVTKGKATIDEKANFDIACQTKDVDFLEFVMKEAAEIIKRDELPSKKGSRDI